MSILVVGTGYVGQVTAAGLAALGHTVVGLDIDEAKIESLKRGVSPLYEPGLEELISAHLAAGRLSFTTDYAVAKGCSLCFLALPTPPRADGTADLSYLESALDSLEPHLRPGSTLVMKSTVPVGTAMVLKERFPQHSIVSNPEFLREGSGVHDFLHPDRIVLGMDRPESEHLMRALYAPLHLPPEKVLCMDFCSAEMTKYASNCLLASRISFMNEMAALCGCLGADLAQVKRGMGCDPRIGPLFLSAGVGFGGSCFPKDLEALRALGRAQGIATPLLDATVAVNTAQKQLAVATLKSIFAPLGGLEGRRVAIWGVAFKPGTDDIREAPALTSIRALLGEGASCHLVDPVALKSVRALFGKNPQLHFFQDVYECSTGVDAIVLMTEWEEFASVSFERLSKLVRGHLFFDGRNLFVPEQLTACGFDYVGIGRPVKLAHRC